jgi:hypothetical protein
MSQISELNEILHWLLKTPSGTYPLKEKYIVLRELSYGGKVYKRGDYIYFSEETAKKISFGNVQKSKDQKELEETIRKIKFYIDFRGKLNIPEVTFSKDFKRVKIYDRI